MGKMKLGEVMKIRKVLFEHKDDKTKGATSTLYKMSRFLFDSDSDAGFCQKKLKELAAEYTDENGVIDEKKEEYETKLEELLNTETGRSIEFTVDELKTFELSLEDIISLNSCIKEET